MVSRAAFRPSAPPRPYPFHSSSLSFRLDSLVFAESQVLSIYFSFIPRAVPLIRRPPKYITAPPRPPAAMKEAFFPQPIILSFTFLAILTPATLEFRATEMVIMIRMMGMADLIMTPRMTVSPASPETAEASPDMAVLYDWIVLAKRTETSSISMAAGANTRFPTSFFHHSSAYPLRPGTNFMNPIGENMTRTTNDTTRMTKSTARIQSATANMNMKMIATTRVGTSESFPLLPSNSFSIPVALRRDPPATWDIDSPPALDPSTC